MSMPALVGEKKPRRKPVVRPGGQLRARRRLKIKGETLDYKLAT
jgi:hypothetical protein